MEYTKDIKELESEKCLASVKNLPWEKQLAVGAFGLTIIIFAPHYWYLGVFLVVPAVLPLIFSTDYVTCKVYSDKLAALDPGNKDKCAVVKYEDIISYNMDIKQGSYVLLTLKGKNEGEIVQETISTYRAGSLRKQMLKVLPDKDTEQLRIIKNREEEKAEKEKKRLYKEIKAKQRQKKNAQKSE